MRTLKSIGKLHLLIEEMVRMNGGDIFGVTEVRWSGKGHFTTLHNHIVYYSGSEKGGIAGVAFTLKPSIINKAALGYNPVNERFLTIRLQCKPFPVTIIVNYSPTNDATDEEIEEHYSKLQALIDKKTKQGHFSHTW